MYIVKSCQTPRDPGNEEISPVKSEGIGQHGSRLDAREFQVTSNIFESRLFSCVYCCHEHVFTVRVMHAGSRLLKDKVRNIAPTSLSLFCFGVLVLLFCFAFLLFSIFLLK